MFLFIFIHIPASIVINFFSGLAPHPPFPSPLQPWNLPASDNLSCVFRAGLGICPFLRATRRRGRVPPPPSPTRLNMSPGWLSIEFCAVFPAGRKNRTNWLHFSYRQETRSGGFPIFDPLSALSPSPAPHEKYRNFTPLPPRRRGKKNSQSRRRKQLSGGARTPDFGVRGAYFAKITNFQNERLPAHSGARVSGRAADPQKRGSALQFPARC